MKKIMFNDKYGLTSAVLAGNKTMTRRVIKPQPILDENVGFIWKDHAYGIGFNKSETFTNFLGCVKPPYKVGEIVAVAQAYKQILEPDKILYISNGEGYRMVKAKEVPGWSNKMFVGSEIMPNQIRITGVSIEILQDISDEDCIKEGIMIGDFINTWDRYYFDSFGECANHNTFKTPRDAYASLIDRISGKGTWEENPWVWVYEFELVGGVK